MPRHMSIEECDNGFMCTGTQDHEYPGTKTIAKDMDEVHRHIIKHFKGKEKPKSKESDRRSLTGLAKH